MVSLKLFLFPFIPLFFLQPLTKGQACDGVSCGDVSIEFPFRLTGQPDCCGNPNFNLTCITSQADQTMIAFPFNGEFRVEVISYSTPSIQLSDPGNCIPRRLLQGLDLSGTPFQPLYPQSLILFNCSSNVSINYPAIGFSCLSGTNFSVGAMFATIYNQTGLSQSCAEIATILVPLGTPYFPEHYMDNLLLTWENPYVQMLCDNCESHDVDGGCSSGNLKRKTGLASGTKYALIFILGAPVFLIVLCIIQLNIRVHCYGERLQSNAEISSLAAEPRLDTSTADGLDGPRIEAYPITLLGESCQLPRPNDITCSICLSEYQANEKLRTIPSCDHYFHADCIDEWLKLNAACPVCRNTPDQKSASITHSTNTATDD
ncbi:hypothetical protein DITRI_Ditri04bG0140400 [Diplodiscus trichospermus]